MKRSQSTIYMRAKAGRRETRKVAYVDTNTPQEVRLEEAWESDLSRTGFVLVNAAHFSWSFPAVLTVCRRPTEVPVAADPSETGLWQAPGPLKQILGHSETGPNADLRPR